ncbi:class 1 fructose-bisphosphatase [Sedimentimonas flavescens]|uniref:class 1 fructose-bisphosphatase n=1 Tax=Sedimentimonas flavescens TaxID=2851012 RepID=UPI0021A6393A|nr:class 1 fructose-bisphosphatase [Sedimentimonas flavescens]MCT2538393.1 class 1 fructose-bisphosphatase [Sedimentimonas flavescens]
MSLDLTGLSLGPELTDVMQRLTQVGAELQRLIARNGIDGDLGASAGTNAGGDGQKALDVLADEAFMAALRDSAVAYYASEEQDDILTFGDGLLALAIDPLDGSSNIDVNVSIGTIFSIYHKAETAEASFLRPGSEQLAAGYMIFGPQCSLIATFGQGVLQWVLDPNTGRFERLADLPPMAPETSEFAINASNKRHWPAPIQAFIDHLIAGADGPRGRNFNMRWIASLVAETHRILKRGGVFLYPGDSRRGYERGRLRHLYECAPIAFVVTQAGGAATDGYLPILDAIPDSLHARTPFVFGTAPKVRRIARYHDHPEEAALIPDEELHR